MQKHIIRRLTVALTIVSAMLLTLLTVVSMFCQPDDYSKSHGLLLNLLFVFSVLDIAIFFLLKSIVFSFIDYMVICLVFAVTACHLAHGVPAGELRFMSAIMTASVFICIRNVVTCFPSLFMKVFMIGLSLVTLWQVLYGLLQTAGVMNSNSELFCCTGSFTNPGPFGGFLAVSAVGMWVWNQGRKGVPAIVVKVGIAASVIGIAASSSRAALISMAVPAVVWICTLPSFKEKIIALRTAKPCRFVLYSALATITVVGSVSLMYNMKKGSADSRLLINKISLRAMADAGLTGSGLGGFPASFAKAQAEYFSDGNYSETERLLADCPQKAFNEFIEIGIEAGPLTMILAMSIVIVSLCVLIPRRSPLGYMLLALTVFSLFSYPLLFMQFRILAAVCVASAAEILSCKSEHHTYHSVVWAVSFAAVFIGLVLIRKPLERHIEASDEWHQCSIWYDSSFYKAVCDNYGKLYDCMKHHPIFLAQYGLSLAAIGELDRSDSVMTAMTLVSSDPLPYNRMAENCLERGDSKAAESLFRKSFAMVPNRLVPLAGIARSLYAQGEMDRFRLVADSISRFVPKVESSTTAGIREEIARLYIENR